MLLTLSACHPSGKPAEQESTNDSTNTTQAEVQKADSTLYGTADEFGMSTFTLITTQGDTLNLTRIDSNGSEGHIYGSLREDERYALVTQDNQTAIKTLINLTQLEKHIKNYSIYNGRLVIGNDTVQIKKLSDTQFEYE